MLSLKELCLINIPLDRYNFDNKDYFYLVRLANLNYDKYNENIQYEDVVHFYLEIIITSTKQSCGYTILNNSVVEIFYFENGKLLDYIKEYAKTFMKYPCERYICEPIIIAGIEKVIKKHKKHGRNYDYDSYNLNSFYWSMNNKFLKTLLKKRGYKRYSKLRKKELVKMITS